MRKVDIIIVECSKHINSRYFGGITYKENVSEQYNIKAIHEQKYNEFKSIIDNIPYDLF